MTPPRAQLHDLGGPAPGSPTADATFSKFAALFSSISEGVLLCCLVALCMLPLAGICAVLVFPSMLPWKERRSISFLWKEQPLLLFQQHRVRANLSTPSCMLGLANMLQSRGKDGTGSLSLPHACCDSETTCMLRCWKRTPLPVLAAGSGGATVCAEEVSRMPLKEVFRRRQEYGTALQCLFDVGAAQPGCSAQADLARLVCLWVRQPSSPPALACS